jgi:hypothetical protein
MALLINDSSSGMSALKFARALVSMDFDLAYSMLTKATRQVMAKDDLIDDYTQMISYGDGPADECEVMIVDDDMPEMGKHDLAWVYVAICGKGFSEAVNVMVVEDESTIAIRILGWGRP